MTPRQGKHSTTAKEVPGSASEWAEAAVPSTPLARWSLVLEASIIFTGSRVRTALVNKGPGLLSDESSLFIKMREEGWFISSYSAPCCCEFASGLSRKAGEAKRVDTRTLTQHKRMSTRKRDVLPVSYVCVCLTVCVSE